MGITCDGDTFLSSRNYVTDVATVNPLHPFFFLLMTHHYADYPAWWLFCPTLSCILFSLQPTRPQPRATHTNTDVPPKSGVQTCLCVPSESPTLGLFPAKFIAKKELSAVNICCPCFLLYDNYYIPMFFFFNLWCQLHFIVSMSIYKKITAPRVLWEKTVWLMERTQALEGENPRPYPCCDHNWVITYLLRNVTSSSIKSGQ